MSLPPRSSERRSAWRSSSRSTRPRHELPIGAVIHHERHNTESRG